MRIGGKQRWDFFVVRLWTVVLDVFKGVYILLLLPIKLGFLNLTLLRY